MEVEMKIRGLMMDPVTNMPIVILKDKEGDRVLSPAQVVRAARRRFEAGSFRIIRHTG